MFEPTHPDDVASAIICKAIVHEDDVEMAMDGRGRSATYVRDQLSLTDTTESNHHSRRGT